MKTNKSDSNFQLWMETPQTPPKKQVAIENSLRLHTRARKSGRGRESCIIIMLLKIFFLLIPDLVHGPTTQQRWSPTKIAARWRYRLPMENLTANYKTSPQCTGFTVKFEVLHLIYLGRFQTVVMTRTGTM